MMCLCFCFFFCCSGLDLTASRLVAAGRRPNTTRTYSAAQKQYINFCSTYGLPVLPVSEQSLLRYVAELSLRVGRGGRQGLSASSVGVYLAAMRALAITHGYPIPPTDSPRVLLAINAIALGGPPPVKKAPITFPVLVAMLEAARGVCEGAMLRAALSMGYFLCLRGSEFTAVFSTPRGGSLLVPPPLLGSVYFGFNKGIPYLRYTVPRSKTRLHGFSRVAGCTGQVECAVCLLWTYLVGRFGCGTWDPSALLFVNQSGAVLTRYQFNQAIKLLASRLGLDPSQYTSHSVRSGVATQASLAGCSETEIMALGGWSSSAFLGYLRESLDHQVGLSARLTGDQ